MSMINCPECGKEISDKAKKCVHCGKVLIEDKPATKVCSDCGKENPIDATECVHCGCPFEEGTTVETPVQIAPVEKPKRDLKKIIIPIVVAVVVVVVGLIVYNVKVIKPKNTYNEAMTLLEKGKYNDADKLLKTIEGYKDVNEIIEQVKYESCAYSAVNAVKEILKNPDSISVYEVKFYNGRKDAEDKKDTKESTEDSTEETDTLIDKDHPYITIHLGAQNGFGGNTESFALCAYSKEKKEYKLDAYTKSDDIEQIKEDYDSDDDNYFMYMLGAALLKGYEENGIEVGSIDMDRFKTILKNDAYSTIRIIE